jgi:BirA family biotin operon repressor/biotin-[acetyl-CoA-carboxylase] ligase
VNLGEPPPGVPGAGALQGVDPGELLEGFLSRFRRGYRSDEPGFAEGALDPYRERSVTLGRRIRANAIDGTVVEGLAVDLDQRGGLVVETDDDRATIAFGDVQHLG